MDAATWTSQEWLAGARAWLDEQLSAAGVERRGEVTQPRVRAWGTVLRADTTKGPVWLKAPGPETVFEVPLYRLLATVAPKWVLDPIAVDIERGWVVLPDGGPTLGEVLGDEGLSDALVQVLPQYAQLQLDLMPHTEDLHPNNILGGPAGQVRFYDWGDSVLAHPFSSMLVTLGYTFRTLKVAPDDKLVLRPRDAYLSVFGEPADLLEELDLACWIGKVARSLVWGRALHGDPGRFIDVPLEILGTLKMNSWRDPA